MRLSKNSIVKTFIVLVLAAITLFAHAEVEVNIQPAMSTADCSTWPEKSLVGISGEEAKAEITSADPTLQVEILPEDAMVTMDYREDRVRIFVDVNTGKVARQPNKG